MNNYKFKLFITIINLTILECKLSSLLLYVLIATYNKSNHIGM